MSLKTTIETGIITAMKAKNADRLRALRAIKALILLEATKDGASGDISADAELKLLVKAAKQRKDSADIFRQQNRPDLLEKELAELAVIEEFLPKALSGEELEGKIKKIIVRTGATTMQDLGKVMGVASKELAGQADGKVISATVKALLQ